MPAATTPFGPVLPGPDTYPGSLTGEGGLAHSGYDYSDRQVRGFSHIHRGSSGGTHVYDRAGRLSVVPFSGDRPDTFYVNPVLDMDKASEKAEAGYYAVQLTQDGIGVELTATRYVGFHRYTFPEGKEARIFLNAGPREKGIACTLTDEYTLEGSFDGTYFVLKSDAPIGKTSVWDGVSFTESGLHFK
jgi:putative alpha-1,2-mannosidase